MLQLYHRCQTFQQRPSEALGIGHNQWLAYQFDNAVFVFGSTVMKRYQERDKQNRRVYPSLEACMGIEHKPKAISIAALMARGGVRVKT